MTADADENTAVGHLSLTAITDGAYNTVLGAEAGEALTTGDENVNGEKDELYDKAVNIIKSEGKASTSFLQRKLQIGYNRAARIMEKMEKEGIVGQANHVGKREIL